MTLEEIKAFYARQVAAFAARDVDALISVYSDDCVIETPDAGPLVGRAAIEERFRRIFAAFPDAVLELPIEVVASGDQVVAMATLSGTDARGKRFSLPIVTLVTLRDGRIARQRRIHDGPLRRLKNELDTAAEIQRALLPDGRYTGIGFETAAACVPCQAIGGDLFDYFELSNNALGFVLGDVAGKGPAAALLAAQLQGILTSRSFLSDSPASTVTHVNAALTRRPVDARFVTLVYGVIAPDGRLTYCNAGHNPPLAVGAAGIRRLDRGGPIVGAFPSAQFAEETLHLAPGDTVIAYTDGVTEALNTDGEEFGEHRLIASVDASPRLSASELLRRVFDRVRTFSAGTLPVDDVTALVLQYTGR